ncbi:MAG: peptidoglycan-binding protein, partial [Saccharospirillaceae bacterium]|nr:peptidoglycan-binding protein [Saccharospirillaceae bacterium]
AASRRLWRASGGVPRLINNLADRALLGAYASGRQQVNVALVKGAEREILGEAPRFSWTAVKPLLALTALLAVLLPVAMFGPSLKDTVLAWQTPVADVVASPLSLLTAGTDSPATRCEQLQGERRQCLWVDWPFLRLQQLSLPVAVQMKTSEGFDWRLLSDELNPASFTGQALLLWQPPAGYNGQLVRPGQTSDLILWIRRKLNMEWQADWQVISPEGKNSQVDSRFYDPLLANRVAQFQAEHGLSADKIIGPETLLMMQNVGRATDASGLAAEEG